MRDIWKECLALLLVLQEACRFLEERGENGKVSISVNCRLSRPSALHRNSHSSLLSTCKLTFVVLSTILLVETPLRAYRGHGHGHVQRELVSGREPMAHCDAMDASLCVDHRGGSVEALVSMKLLVFVVLLKGHSGNRAFYSTEYDGL